ncbi:MAG: M48 family metallopeptidase [Rhodobacteraceae bacterium]|nr:M48 family metallopeptidase [Paracoccaceae bacterium]
MAWFLNSSKPDWLTPDWLSEILGSDLAARLSVRSHPRARRVSLRVDSQAGVIVLVRPRRASEKFIAAFVAEKKSWIAKHAAQLDALPGETSVADGMTISLFGEAVTVRHAGQSRAGVWREGDILYVSGRAEHLARRVRDWLKAEARRELTQIAREFAAVIERKVARVGVRDTRSRWGSCNAKGEISLSWRLILAPADVARYVVAHEVSHLKHLDHSPAFWRTVAELCPGRENARAWLKRNGAALHRVVV